MAASKKLHHLSVQLLSDIVRGLWESMAPKPDLQELGTSQKVVPFSCLTRLHYFFFVLFFVFCLFYLFIYFFNFIFKLNITVLDCTIEFTWCGHFQAISGGPICDNLFLNRNWDKNSRHISIYLNFFWLSKSQKKRVWEPHTLSPSAFLPIYMMHTLDSARARFSLRFPTLPMSFSLMLWPWQAEGGLSLYCARHPIIWVLITWFLI